MLFIFVQLKIVFQPVLIILLSVSVLCMGCGASSSSEKVTGVVEISVTYAGKPVSEGVIQMAKVGEGVYSSSQLDSGGHAEIPDTEVGDYTVFITPPSGPAPHERSGPAAKPKEYPNIPLKFRSEMTSTLKAKVASGENEFHFELAEHN